MLPEAPPHPLLADVAEITIAADPATIERLSAVHAAGVVLRFVPATASKRGIVRVVLEVHGARKEELRLGKSVLRFDGHGRAVWDF